MSPNQRQVLPGTAGVWQHSLGFRKEWSGGVAVGDVELVSEMLGDMQILTNHRLVLNCVNQSEEISPVDCPLRQEHP